MTLPGSETQAPILTVTLNPALDLSTAADEVRPDLKLRCDKPVVDPGGGGINVSRAIKVLGGQSTAMVALGGATGTRIADLLKSDGLSILRLTAPGETRQSLAVTDRATGSQYRFVMPGPEWHTTHVSDMMSAISETARAGGWVVVSGSNPPGVAPGFEQMLTVRLKDGRARLLVDTSGEALQALAGSSTPVDVLRIRRRAGQRRCRQVRHRRPWRRRVGDRRPRRRVACRGSARKGGQRGRRRGQFRGGVRPGPGPRMARGRGACTWCRSRLCCGHDTGDRAVPRP